MASRSLLLRNIKLFRLLSSSRLPSSLHHREVLFKSPILTTCHRCISTSDKKKDAVVIPHADEHLGSSGEKIRDWDDIVNETIDKKHKYWMPFGFVDDDIEMDVILMHVCSFLLITVVFIGGAFVFMHLPITEEFDWIQREAYLEMDRREKSGLPYVDANLLPVERVIKTIPSDEELQDFEIIV